MREADVVVVGGGVMGSSTAWWLARQGNRVVVLERFAIGHNHGSSHGRSRIFRFSYPLPLYVAMAMEALPLWRELERESGRTILTTAGGLDTGKVLDEHVLSLRECDATFELIDGAEANRRFPVLRFDEDAVVLFQPDAGWVAADEAWRAFADLAGRHGAEVREGTRVLEVRDLGGQVEVRTEDQTWRAGATVVTAGAWARGLLAGAGIDLPVRPTRETVGFFRVPDGLRVPVVVDWGDPAVYTLPSPGDGIKIGQHGGGPDIDPDAEPGGPDQETLARLAAWVAERYRGADERPHLAQTCLYTNTDDERLIVERHGSIVVGSPCSGHGFKFAPLIGKRLAELAVA